MNMKNMIRKVAAVGAGATMVGATLMGALAASLADYPAPFVSDGAFDAVLVVGDNAAAADIIGVTDIAMALQFNMKTTESVSSSSGETTVTGGEVEDELALDDSVNGSYKDSDVAVLLDDEFDYDGEEYGFEETLTLTDGFFTLVQNEEDHETDVYLEVSADSTTGYKWSPDSNLTFVANEDLDITFLGKDLTITGGAAGDKVTLSSADETWLSTGESVTSGDYTITVNKIYDEEAKFTVNGVVEVVSGTEDFGFNDFELRYVDSVNDDGTENDEVKFKYGTMVSETAEDGTAAETLGYGDDDTEAEWLWDIRSNATTLQYIGVVYNQDRDELDSDISVDYELPMLSVGDSIDFPNGYAQFEFAGLSNDDTRETFTITEDDDLDFNVEIDGSTVKVIDNAVGFVMESDEAIFIVAGEEYVKVTVPRNAMNSTIGLTDSNGETSNTSYVNSTISASTMVTIKLDEVSKQVTFENTSTDYNITRILIADLGLTGDLNWTFDYDDTTDADDKDLLYDGSAISTRDYDFMTDYGTIIYEIESGIDEKYGSVKVAIPSEAVTWNLAVAAESSTTALTTTTTDVVTQIEVGATKLASEVADVTAQNSIVVGGPCANAAAASLMGNPSPCYAGFTEGEAMVKLYENGGNTALLVAGATADDTRTAAKLVANGGIASVDGMEAVVTTLTESVTAPAPAPAAEETTEEAAE